jgi:putative chitinase
MFTENHLAASGAATPSVAKKVTPFLVAAAEHWKINTPRKIAAWLAQLSHESMGFTRVEENLNYSAKRLLEVFPKRVTPEKAKELDHDPIAIGNFLYGDRKTLGNLGQASGDGWNFRGRGFIQVTGRNNYRECGKALGIDLLSHPQLLKELKWAAESGGWYWDVNNLGPLAEANDIIGVSIAVNLGRSRVNEKSAHKRVIGLEERISLYRDILGVL